MAIKINEGAQSSIVTEDEHDTCNLGIAECVWYKLSQDV